MSKAVSDPNRQMVLSRELLAAFHPNAAGEKGRGRFNLVIARLMVNKNPARRKIDGGQDPRPMSGLNLGQSQSLSAGSLRRIVSRIRG